MAVDFEGEKAGDPNYAAGNSTSYDSSPDDSTAGDDEIVYAIYEKLMQFPGFAARERAVQSQVTPGSLENMGKTQDLGSRRGSN